MRHRIVSGMAAGMGVIALLLGGAGCTGGDEGGPSGSATASQEAPDGDDDTASPQESTPAPSDGGGGQDDPLDHAALEAASQRFVEVLRVLDDRDWEAACTYVLDPTTGAAPEGERLTDSAEGAQSAIAPHEELLAPGVFEAIDASSVTASDNGDGTVSLRVLDEEIDVPMVRGEDDLWYLSIPF